MQIILLTHERELERQSNTGRLALEAFPGRVKRLVWSRTQPDPELVAALALGEACLLFPAREGCTDGDVDVPGNTDIPADTIRDTPSDASGETPKTLVILDATWQEARKMLRQSPYLDRATRYVLPPATVNQGPSKFRLRRNQIAGGLCTLECIIVLWCHAGITQEAALLQQRFETFNLRGKDSPVVD